jgi:SMI1-KNR4 cell-wall
VSVRDDLMQLVPPPAEVSDAAVDWEQLEASLGVELPGDYKWLISTYGPGKFDDFLYVLQPTSPFGPIRLEESAQRSTEILEQLATGQREVLPYAPRELMPVAKTDNGDTVYWVKKLGVDPGSWIIVGNGARNAKWPEFNGGIVDFLMAVLSGSRRFEIFPRSFPSAHPLFEKLPERSNRRR